MNRNDWIRQQAARRQGVTVAELREQFPEMSPTFACNVFYAATRAKSQPLLAAKIKGHKHRWFLHEHDRAHYLDSTPEVDWKAVPTDAERRAAKNKLMAAWRSKQKEQRAQLHDLGVHMPALARDGRKVSKHQATFDRQRQATVRVQPVRDVDYSRAKVTVCPSAPANRWEPVGPVHSVVDPEQCRGWAKAATA
jgi:hypothetical protein